MKKFFIFLGTLAVIVALLHVAFFVFINLKGKDVITTAIQKNLGLEVSLESLSVKFPFTVEVKNFTCPNVAIKKINILPAIINPLKPRIILNQVYLEGLTARFTQDRRPVTGTEISWNKKQPVLPELPVPDAGKEHPAQKSEPVDSAIVSDKSKTVDLIPEVKIPVTINHIHLKNSSFELLTLTKKGPIRVIFEDIKASIRNFTYPELAKVYLELTASLRSDKAVAKNILGINGWSDYPRRDMDINLSLSSLDYFLFSDYYPSFWQPANTGIKEASFSLNTNFNSQNNDLTINSTLLVDKAEFVEDEQKKTNKDLIRTILALLPKEENKPKFNFIIKTKMDSPVLDFSSVGKDLRTYMPLVSTFLIQEAVGRIAELADEGNEKVGQAKEVSVDKTIEAIKTFGEEIGDKFKEMFKPKESNTTNQIDEPASSTGNQTSQN